MLQINAQVFGFTVDKQIAFNNGAIIRDLNQSKLIHPTILLRLKINPAGSAGTGSTNWLRMSPSRS